MNYKDFFIRFGIFSTIIAFLIPLLGVLPELREFQQLGWMTWGLFIFLTLSMFFLGKMALRSSNKGLFDGLLLSFNFLKIFSALIFIFTYITSYQPNSNWFLLPFFFIYFLFTIFEVDMLSKMGKSN